MASGSDPSPARRLVFWAVSILLLLAVMEGASLIFLHLVIGSRAHFLIWDPDFAAAHRQWAEVGGKWDDELGWPPPQDVVLPPRDKDGAKLNPDFPAPAKPCASAYGDSFVWGDDVPLKDGWVEQLSRKLGCRVANYAVGGYGTDQAYVRFTRMTDDLAPVALLGIFPENAMRNVNQYRQLIGFNQTPLALKGRFVLDANNKLEWIHRPKIDEAGYLQLLRSPASVVPRDFMLPDTQDGPVTLCFPYLLTLVRVALMQRLWVRINGSPSWGDFYQPDHPSGALALTAAIAEAFAHDAESRGKRALTVMLPGATSFQARAKNGAPEYQPLLKLLAERNVAVFDPGPALIAALGPKSYCELYAVPSNCTGHYGVYGSSLVADVMLAELRRRGLVK